MTATARTFDADALLRVSCTPKRPRRGHPFGRVRDTVSGSGGVVVDEGPLWWCATSGHQILAVETDDDVEPFAVRREWHAEEERTAPATFIETVRRLVECARRVGGVVVDTRAVKRLAPPHARRSLGARPHVIALDAPQPPGDDALGTVRRYALAGSLRAVHALDDGVARAAWCPRFGALVIAGAVGGRLALVASTAQYAAWVDNRGIVVGRLKVGRYDEGVTLV